MSAYLNACNRRSRTRRSNWTYDSGSWSASSGGYGRSGSQWDYSSRWGWYQKRWEAREDLWRNFAGEYWQLQSSGAWVKYRGDSNTGECWRRDSSGKWVLQRGDLNADHGQAAVSAVAKGSDPSSTSSSSSSAAMLTQTAAAKSSRYVSRADSAPTGDGASSAPPVLFEVVGDDFIKMVTSRGGTYIFPVVMTERAFASERE